MKDCLAHCIQTIQYVSVHGILVVTKIKVFRILVIDATLAYLQSYKPLTKKLFIIDPAPEFELSPEEFPEPLKLICGLADSRNDCHGTLDGHILIDLKMTPTVIDPSLYHQLVDDQLDEINGSYVDDLLQAGTDN